MNTYRETLQAAAPLSRRSRSLAWYFFAVAMFASPARAHASFLQGDTLDSVANGIAWAALIIAPIVGIVVFLLIHILPEKIAHKKGHPQTGAIQCLCLLSLVFGGLLWPFAWLWAYTKPVGYKLAYGTDKIDHDQDEKVAAASSEVEKLRARIVELETQIKGGKA